MPSMVDQLSNHTNYLTKKGNRMAGLVWRNVRLCRNEQVFDSFRTGITTAYNQLHGKCDVFGPPTLKCFRKQVNKAMSCNQ